MLIPIDVDFSGTTDGAGNFSSTPVSPATIGWGALKVTAQTSASAFWTVIIGGGVKAFGRGPRIDVSVLVQPAQSLQVQVTGGPAGALVSGKVHGVGGADLAEVSPFVSLVPNTLAIDPTSTSIFQGPLQGSLGGTNLNLTLPALTTSLLVIATAIDANSHVKVVGVNSGKTYLDVNLTAIGQQVLAPATGSFDSRDYAQNGITVTVSNAVTTNTALYFVTQAAVIPSNSPSLPLWVVTAGFNVGITGQPIQVVQPTGGEIAVTLRFTSPAPWQAATKAPVQFHASLASGATAALVAAVGGQKVYLHALNTDAEATANTLIDLQDTGGTSYDERDLVASINRASSVFAGAPLPVGLGAQLKNVGAASGVLSGSLAYSQAA